jgi:hypothetical protein
MPALQAMKTFWVLCSRASATLQPGLSHLGLSARCSMRSGCGPNAAPPGLDDSKVLIR